MLKAVEVAVIALLALSPTQQAEKRDVPGLKRGQPVERDVKGGETHSYRLRLKPNQFVSVVVEQQGIDAVITLFGPDDQILQTVDSPNGAFGPELLLAIADKKRNYRLEVRPFDDAARAGKYRIRIEELRDATGNDRNRISRLESARAAVAEARELQGKGDHASLTASIRSYEKALGLWRELADRYWQAHTLEQIGAVNRSLGNAQRAIEFFSEVLTIRRELGDRAGEASTLNRTGISYEALGEKLKALEFYRQAADLSRVISDRGLEAIALNNAGFVNNSLGEKQKALDLYNQALALLREVGDRRTEAITLHNIGLTHSSLGDKKKALEFYNQSLPLRRASGDRNGEAIELQSIGFIYDSLQEKEKAVDFYTQALTQFRAIGARASQADVLDELALVHRSLTKLSDALEFARQALSIFKELGDKDGEARMLNQLGLIHASRGDQKLALEFHDQSAVLRRASGNARGEAIALYNIGSVYDSMGDKKKALEFYEKALPLRRAAGDRKYEAITLNSIATVLNNLGDVEKALRTHNQALEIARAISDRSVEAESLAGIGAAYGSRGDRRKALENYDRALSLFRLLNNRSFEAGVMVAIGVIHSVDNRQRALEFLNPALSLSRATGDRLTEAYALTCLGALYNIYGDKRKALDLYEQALVLHRAIKNRVGEAQTLTILATIHNSRGEKQKALDVLNQALSTFNEIGDQSGAAFALNGISTVYFWLGETQKSLESLTQLLPLYRATENRIFESITLTGIGIDYHFLNDYSKALEFLNQALALSRRIEDRLGEAYARMGIGIVYLSLHENQKALDSLSPALTYFRASGPRFCEGYTLCSIGRALEALGDRPKALDFFNRALVLSRQDEEGDVEGYTLPCLMSFWKSSNNPRLAIFYGKQAINAFQRVRSNIRELDKGLQKSFLASKQDTYRQLADLLINQGRLPEAQQVLGLLKEQEYFEYVRGDATASVLLLRSDLTPEEESAAKRYNEIADQITTIAREFGALQAAGTAPTDERYLKLHADLEAANRTFQVLLRQLTNEFGTQSRRVAEIQADSGLQSDFTQWGEGAVALYTIVGEENYRVILTTPEVRIAREARPKIRGEDLNKLILEFREAIQNPSVNPEPLAQQLYRILLAPVARDLAAAGAKTLVWSLDGPLRYLPIAALHDGNRYVVEQYQNVIITLASRTRISSQPGRNWRGLGLGMSKGVVKEWGKFRPLPSVREELRGIIREENQKQPMTGILTGRVYLDEEFTETSMKTALGQGAYPLVHIASHFSFKPGNNAESFLLLGDGSRFTLDKLNVSPIPFFGGVQLLTLSACDTATGGGANGNEVEGFAALAQLKGAQAVLATLWPVFDESTQRLMQGFYENLVTRGGITKTEALRQAQLKLLLGERGYQLKHQSDSSGAKANAGRRNVASRVFVADPNAPFAHPYFWAPFILIGNWR
jgi:CHAT domain-containing protein/Tfp pilus assembly protein PilF